MSTGFGGGGGTLAPHQHSGPSDGGVLDGGTTKIRLENNDTYSLEVFV